MILAAIVVVAHLAAVPAMAGPQVLCQWQEDTGQIELDPNWVARFPGRKFAAGLVYMGGALIHRPGWHKGICAVQFLN